MVQSSVQVCRVRVRTLAVTTPFPRTGLIQQDEYPFPTSFRKPSRKEGRVGLQSRRNPLRVVPAVIPRALGREDRPMINQAVQTAAKNNRTTTIV